MTEEADVIVIGAGAAGLAAARELGTAGLYVTVLEARERIGGRINTHFDKWPIDLGAEFVHGKPGETLAIVERAGLTLQRVPNRHWHWHNGILTKTGEFWSKVEKVMDEMSEYEGPDQSFAEFLSHYGQTHNIQDIESIATLYVEGFHAAHADQIGVHGLNKTNEAAERVEDDKQFRLPNGYSQLAGSLYEDAVASGAVFHLNTVVEEVRWQRDRVEVLTEGSQRFKARKLLLTLPLTVLSRVRFIPAIAETESAARKLAMGQVVKVLMRFREKFWEDDFTFIHAPGELPPTWWSQFPDQKPLLVGWAGGTRADKLSLVSDDALQDQSLKAMSHIFSRSKSELEELLEEFYTHNWRKDRFSAGAYSYIPVNGIDAAARLAQPLDDTLFFAGEATNTEGHQGTVHGAIATGLRAASEVTKTHKRQKGGRLKLEL
jgi:monoamine oxidase